MLGSVSRGLANVSSALKSRCAYAPYLDRVCKPEDTVQLFKDGMAVGWSGFTPVGDPKAVPIALSEYVEANKLQGKLRFDVFIGASAGAKNEDRWGQNNMIRRRYPYQNGNNIRKNINSGKTHFADKHLSMFAQDVSWGFYTKQRGGGLDIAIIEATEILPDGSVVLAGAVGSAVEFMDCADKIIIEVNTAIPSDRKSVV